MPDKMMLFCPGPVLTSERVKQALTGPDLCHRRPEFENLYQHIRNRLLALCGADENYAAVVISGSGTAANEAALSSLITDKDEVLLLKNGEYGENLEEILTAYSFPFRVLSYDWGKPFDLGEVEAALTANPRLSWICMVYHETSTGMRNPLRQVSRLAAKYQRKLFSDCVSAFGSEVLDVRRDHLDAFTSVPYTAVGGLPGLGFVIVRRSSLPQEVKPRNVYLNLLKAIAIADSNSQTPNTPAAPLFAALEIALNELAEETIKGRIQRYQKNARIIRKGVQTIKLPGQSHRVGLRRLILDEYSGNTVTSVFLPQEMNLEEFINALERRGYVVYPGKRHLYAQNMFQIANMGALGPENFEKFIEVLKEVLA